MKNCTTFVSAIKIRDVVGTPIKTGRDEDQAIYYWFLNQEILNQEILNQDFPKTGLSWKNVPPSFRPVLNFQGNFIKLSLIQGWVMRLIQFNQLYRIFLLEILL